MSAAWVTRSGIIRRTLWDDKKFGTRSIAQNQNIQFKMNTIESTELLNDLMINVAESAPTRLCRGVVGQITANGEVFVCMPGQTVIITVCDVLLGGGRLSLTVDDPVLVLMPALREERGVVLGRVGAYTQQAIAATQSVDHFQVVAKETISLKCGESAIEMRKDGKVLIKGKDVVSYAKRTQRIKGGSVAIN